jgi:hypothetical protein
MNQGAGANAERRNGTGARALGGAAADNVQSVRPRRDIQQQSGQYEQPNIVRT